MDSSQMMNSKPVDFEESPSPFFHYPLSPELFPEELNIQLAMSPQISDIDTNGSPVSCNSWSYQPDSAYGHENDFHYFAPEQIDDHALMSFDAEATSLINTDLDEIEPVPKETNENRKENVLRHSRGSVTSKLKSVLMSRRKHNSEANSASNGCHGNGSRSLSSSTQTSRYQPNSSLRFPPCFVCGGTASGLHYGVNSCEPCKGFFTRYLRKKEIYKCTKDGNCPVTNRLRGNCSSCRLKKCLALGMSRQNSRLGRYSLSRRMATIRQMNELERRTIEQGVQQTAQDTSSVTEGFVNSSTDSEASSDSLTPAAVFQQPKSAPGRCKVKAPSGFSHKLVRTLAENMEKIQPYGENLVTEEQIIATLNSHYETYKLKNNLFGNMKTIPKDEYFDLLKRFGIEIDKRMTFLKEGESGMIAIIERYCNFAKQIPNFKALSSKDQSNLLKSSRYDFFMILMHEGYLHDKQVFLAHNGIAFHQEEVADKFFSRKLVINVCDMYHRLQKLKLSKEEKALLIAICLLFTDRCSLENPHLVQQIQLSLTQLLQRQLEKTCPSSAVRRFTKIIDSLTIMRESSELYLKEYNELCQDKMVIEEVPIMTELLFEDE